MRDDGRAPAGRPLPRTCLHTDVSEANIPAETADSAVLLFLKKVALTFSSLLW